MKRRGSWFPSEDGPRSAQIILDGVVHDLGDLIAARGVHTEEMIRLSGFFESAKALWLATDSAHEPMPSSVLAHRLRVLADICPPELREFGERLELGLKILEESERRQKRA